MLTWIKNKVREYALSQIGPDDVEWVTNNLAELGVKIGDRFFFLYKGESFEYLTDNEPWDDKPMYWRPIGKREFGECAYPINHDNPHRIGTVNLDDCDRWEIMPRPTQNE